MATLDEVISQMSEEDYFSDQIQFIIDSNLRIVSVPDRGVVAGVVGDKNVNRINFQMPRYYNGFDMSKFKTRINYVNAEGKPNYYTVTDLTIKDDLLIFSWLVDTDVVAYVGTVAFSVNMVLAGDDGVIKQAFNTSNVEKLKALKGIQVDKYISYEEQVDLISKLEADLTKYISSGINQIQDEGAKVKKSLPADYIKMTEDVTSLKEGIGGIPKKQGYLSSYITDSTIKIDNEIYDVTTIIDELLKNGCKKIVVDVDCYVKKSIIPKNGIEIVGNGKSVFYFESGDGFNFSEGSDNVSIHDLIIKGYNIQDDVNIKDNWLINISSDLHNVKLYNLDIESGYNGIKINGWINNYQNIIVSYFKGIGVYIGRSDNTFNTFYINGCRKEGLYISSSNNRIDNIKILSCGENSDSSCFFKGNRNTISNVEIQDIYNKCAIFKDFNNNILNINLDGIRTHITDDASIVLAEFVNCSRNVINLISSKYGSSVNDSSKDDIISLNSNCNTNSLILSSLKVALQDGGVKNNITVLKNDIVSYNIDKILTLEETYSAKKPTNIYYVKCTNVSNEYSDAMYAFKNSGDVTYSGIRFTLKEKQKLFCVVVLSSNTAYTEQTNATLMLTDQQDNINSIKSIGNLENNQVLTLIGADDASSFSWAVLNNTMNSSTITKIKYIGFFDFKNYSAIMSNIIN